MGPITAVDGQSAESRKAKRSETRANRSLKDMSRYHTVYCPICCFPLQPVALSFLPGGTLI